MKMQNDKATRHNYKCSLEIPKNLVLLNFSPSPHMFVLVKIFPNVASHTILEINRSFSSEIGSLHLQQLEAEVTADILSTSSITGSALPVWSSAILVLLSDLLSSTADVTLVMITCSVIIREILVRASCNHY